MTTRLDSVDHGPWIKGVSYVLPTEDIEEEQLAAMENCRIGQAGQVEKRLGYAKYAGIAAVAGTAGQITCTGFGELLEPPSTTTIFAVFGPKFYEKTFPDAWTDRTGAVVITHGDDNVFEFAQVNGTLYGVNGINGGIKWTGAGNNITNMTMPSGVTSSSRIAFWDNRIWLGGDDVNNDRLHRSDTGDYENFNNFHNLGSPITALAPMQESLSVHTKTGIWTLTPTGNAEVPYQVTQVTRLASEAGRGIETLSGEKQFMIRRDGIYRWSEGEEVEKISFNIDGYWVDVNKARIEYAFTTQYPQENEIWFFLPYGQGQQPMNSIMVYNWRDDDEREGMWYGPYNGPDPNFDRYCAGLIDDKPHAGAATGLLYDHASGHDDDGAAISAFFQTGGKPPEDIATEVRWFYARLVYDDTGAYSVTVNQVSPQVSGTSRALTLGDNTSGTLDNFTLDQDALGSGSASKPAVLMSDVNLQGYASTMALKVTNNNAGEPFVFRHVHLVYRTLGRVRRRRTGVE